MDCGPAALHSLLSGFGIASSYGRLREACQTDVDGTSIDTLEVAANQLGLAAEQVLVPVEHALLAEGGCLPALAVTRLETGATHFVVLWRRHAAIVQLMDPAVGRRWVAERQLRTELYLHQVVVPVTDWLTFAQGADFQAALGARVQALGVKSGPILQRAMLDCTWQSIGSLDAAVRLVSCMTESRAVARGQEAGCILQKFCEAPHMIPAHLWTVQPDPDGDNEQILVKGAVLVRVTGKQEPQQLEDLTGELAAVRAERAAHPFSAIILYLQGCGRLRVAGLLLAPLLISLGLLTEALLFRGLFDIASQLPLHGQRLGAFAALVAFSSLLLGLECAAFAAGARLSRYLENRLRIAFLEKLPRLSDRFLQSRLLSDMAERCHAVHKLRHMPDLCRQLLHAICELGATAAGIYVLEPVTGPLVIAIILAILLPAWIMQPFLEERDLRVRAHAGGLTRFYLDAMAGLRSIRAHGCEKSMLRQHERLVAEWGRSAMRLQQTVVWSEAVQTTLVFGLVSSLVVFHPLQGAEIGRVLLVVYWALNLPVIGQEVSTISRQIPYYRNITARLLEPVGAPEEQQPVAPLQPYPDAPVIEFCQVRAQASGHTILQDISVRLEAGSHVALVGRSGAGKSSLAGILLGWLKPTEGEVLIGGAPLHVASLRQTTAWVDPSIQIWNRSLYSNLQYGSKENSTPIGESIDLAMLRTVLENLPEGLQTKLGESGGLVSGGEGQRVRMARALSRKDAQLVILDEPFRGLDREKRRELLRRTRAFWSHATLICITHDLSETAEFDRVLVMDAGQIAEDGTPAELLSDSESRYARLVEAETQAAEELWGAPFWRRIHLHGGRLLEETVPSREHPRLDHEIETEFVA